MTDEELRTRFTYHPPKGDQPERYEEILDTWFSMFFPRAMAWFEAQGFLNSPAAVRVPVGVEEIRDCGRQFAVLIDADCPESREKSLALTKVEEAVMWANAAIARREVGVPGVTPFTEGVARIADALKAPECEKS